MIGLGKYKTSINNMFFKGDAIFELENDNGKYELELELIGADFDIPDFELKDVTEDGETLLAKAVTSLLPGKEIDISLTFENDKCNGFIKIPFVGKVKIKDAVKIG